jgi:hypothetical protein
MNKVQVHLKYRHDKADCLLLLFMFEYLTCMCVFMFMAHLSERNKQITTTSLFGVSSLSGGRLRREQQQ